MQAIKRNFKKILICLLTVIMCLSPVLLAGCTSTSDPGGNTSSGGSSGGSGGSSSGGGSSGGSGSGSSGGSGGSSGGGSSSGGGQEQYDPKDYFSGYKFAYRPASGNEKQFIIDVRNQNYQFTLEIMEALYNTYGYAVGAVNTYGYAVGAVNTDLVTCDEDGNVKVTINGKQAFSNNGTNPTYSKKYFINLKDKNKDLHFEITNGGVLQIVDSNSGRTYTFDPSNPIIDNSVDGNAYGKYFSYENAIAKDSPRGTEDPNGEYENEEDGEVTNKTEYRRWKMSNAENNDNRDDNDKVTLAKRFLSNHRFRAKIQFAITLITAGYDISPSGNDREIYVNGCSTIDNVFENGNPNNPSDASNRIAEVDEDGVAVSLNGEDKIESFYNYIEENLFLPYEKWIDHSGYTASEQQKIANYICDDVIGTSLVKRDNNRFVNVYKPLGADANYRYPVSKEPSLQEKYKRYLTDDNLYGTYLTYSSEGYNDYNLIDRSKESFTYGMNTDSMTEEEKNKLSELDYFMEYLSQAMQNDYYDGEEKFALTRDTVGDQLFEAFDLNGDGKYYGDKYDANGDENYEAFIYETDVKNKNDYQGVRVYSIRLQYFKNYVNTVEDIVTSIAEKTTQIENADGEMEDELVYPRIPACAYANYSCGDLLANDDPSNPNYGELFHMNAGYQNYQNMVFMPKKNVTLNSMWVSFKSNRDSSDPGFDIVVYARYYDATTNSYATWTQGGEETQFYNCGTQTVKNYDNGDFDFLEVDTTSILSSAKIGDEEKGNAVLSPFVNPKGMETFYVTQIITRSSLGGKYYEYIELPDGNKVCVFNETKVPKSQKSSYFELIFSTALSNAYQVSLTFLDFE